MKYITFANANGTTTAIPLGQLSRTEKKLYLSIGGQIKKENPIDRQRNIPARREAGTKQGEQMSTPTTQGNRSCYVKSVMIFSK